MPRHYSTAIRGKSPAQLNREIAEALATRPRTTCYACDDEASGVRDRRPEGGIIEVACVRHADPTISHPRKHHSSINPNVLHVIQGNYYRRGSRGGAWEDLTAETSREEALARLREYRENEPGTPFRRVRRRHPDAKKETGPKKPRRRAATKKPSTREKHAHATRPSGLTAYRNLVKEAIARCSKHPRLNHSLYECVFKEVHEGAPYPTPQMRRILEEAVHAARPASNLHARKKKLDPHEAKQRLKAAGVDFSSDFHRLSSSAVDLILNMARATGYRKRKDAPGSTARMYFQYLSRLR